MGLMMLAASAGSQVIIRCSGKDAQTAIRALSELLAKKFEEE